MIKSFPQLHRGETLGPVDVCIIGSGGGGSTMAYYLSRAGYSVVVLEKGGYWPNEELGRREVALLTRTQAMTIFSPAAGEHTRISLIAGECWGGGTIGCEGNSFDFPDSIKDEWEALGLQSFSRSNKKLNDYMAEVNAKLNVRPIEPKETNPNSQLLALAAAREGIGWKYTHRPVTSCLRCGNCTQGCRWGVKQDAAVTFLKWALEQGAEAYVGAEVKKIRVNHPGPSDEPYAHKLRQPPGAARQDAERELGQRAAAAPAKFTVLAEVVDKRAPVPRSGELPAKGLTVHARQVVLAAGPVGNTRLLLKSGINPHGVVGKRFTTHPSVFSLARFPKKLGLRSWNSMACATEVHHYSNLNYRENYYDPVRHGFLIEAGYSLPWGFSNLLAGEGREHLADMRDFNYFGGLEVIARSDTWGEITPDAVRFELSETDNQRLLFATQLKARLFFRVGAEKVHLGLPGLVLSSPSQLGEIGRYARGKKPGYLFKQANLHSGHLFGGCIMGTDPKRSFVAERGECHTIAGLWAADGSIFPTNTGVNCLLSITMVARKIADEFIARTPQSAAAKMAAR